MRDSIVAWASFTLFCCVVSPASICAGADAEDFPAVKLPAGYIIVPSSVSPNGEYGVSAFDDEVSPIPDRIEDNKVINLQTGETLGAIRANFAIIPMNRGGILPARWSSDSSLVLWEVEGRWSPYALVLLRINDSQIASQLDLLKTAQQAILVRTQKAAPSKYAAAKKWNKGSGSAFPDGFTVNVRVEGDKERGGPKEDVHGVPISLPFKVHVELTSNPKEMDCPKRAQLDSELDGMVTREQKFAVTQFHLRDKPFPNATSSSWLELTNPAAAAQAPPEYGDVVSLKGELTTKPDSAGNSAYILTLKQPISIPASTDYPAEAKVSEIRLLEFDRWGRADALAPGAKRTVFDVQGTLGHGHVADGLPPVTLNVRSYGYRYTGP
jgi:hypothetical protein